MMKTSSFVPSSLPDLNNVANGNSSPTISDLPSELMRTSIQPDQPNQRNFMKNLLSETQTENLAMSQVPDHLYMNEERMIFLTQEQSE